MGRGCNRSHILHPWPNDFCCFRCVVEQWALTVIKLLSFFCINICCFSTRFYFFVPQWHRVIQVSSKLCMFLISVPHKTSTFGVRLYDQYQGNGFAVEVLKLVMPKFKLRSRLWHSDANNCCTQTDRQRSEI